MIVILMMIIVFLFFRLSLVKGQIRKAAPPQCPPLSPAQVAMKVLAPKKYAPHLDGVSSRFGAEREQPALLI